MATEASRYGQQSARGMAAAMMSGDSDHDAAHADQREGERLVLDAVRDPVPDRMRDGGGQHREGDGEGEGGGDGSNRGSYDEAELEP